MPDLSCDNCRGPGQCREQARKPSAAVETGCTARRATLALPAGVIHEKCVLRLPQGTPTGTFGSSTNRKVRPAVSVVKKQIERFPNAAWGQGYQLGVGCGAEDQTTVFLPRRRHQITATATASTTMAPRT